MGLKVRALHDRGFPRDVIDVFSAREMYTIGELERLGAQHDEEFDLEELHGRLEAVDFTSDREYAAYDMSRAHIAKLRAWVRHWLDDLGLRLASRTPRTMTATDPAVTECAAGGSGKR
ncbi:hypothetical protein ACFV16_35770 [Streptomyces massasporeus]|uniref:hypothetical protein n=1 Tax=Streptomyces massasporeus TaxID=67324 RepID=UPI00369618AF